MQTVSNPVSTLTGNSMVKACLSRSLKNIYILLDMKRASIYIDKCLEFINCGIGYLGPEYNFHGHQVANYKLWFEL